MTSDGHDQPDGADGDRFGAGASPRHQTQHHGEAQVEEPGGGDHPGQGTEGHGRGHGAHPPGGDDHHQDEGAGDDEQILALGQHADEVGGDVQQDQGHVDLGPVPVGEADHDGGDDQPEGDEQPRGVDQGEGGVEDDPPRPRARRHPRGQVHVVQLAAVEEGVDGEGHGLDHLGCRGALGQVVGPQVVGDRAEGGDTDEEDDRDGPRPGEAAPRLEALQAGEQHQGAEEGDDDDDDRQQRAAGGWGRTCTARRSSGPARTRPRLLTGAPSWPTAAGCGRPGPSAGQLPTSLESVAVNPPKADECAHPVRGALH